MPPKAARAGRRPGGRRGTEGPATPPPGGGGEPEREAGPRRAGRTHRGARRPRAREAHRGTAGRRRAPPGGRGTRGKTPGRSRSDPDGRGQEPEARQGKKPGDAATSKAEPSAPPGHGRAQRGAAPRGTPERREAGRKRPAAGRAERGGAPPAHGREAGTDGAPPQAAGTEEAGRRRSARDTHAAGANARAGEREPGETDGTPAPKRGAHAATTGKDENGNRTGGRDPQPGARSEDAQKGARAGRKSRRRRRQDGHHPRGGGRTGPKRAPHNEHRAEPRPRAKDGKRREPQRGQRRALTARPPGRGRRGRSHHGGSRAPGHTTSPGQEGPAGGHKNGKTEGRKQTREHPQREMARPGRRRPPKRAAAPRPQPARTAQRGESDQRQGALAPTAGRSPLPLAAGSAALCWPVRRRTGSTGPTDRGPPATPPSAVKRRGACARGTGYRRDLTAREAQPLRDRTAPRAPPEGGALALFDPHDGVRPTEPSVGHGMRSLRGDAPEGHGAGRARRFPAVVPRPSAGCRSASRRWRSYEGVEGWPKAGPWCVWRGLLRLVEPTERCGSCVCRPCSSRARENESETTSSRLG